MRKLFLWAALLCAITSPALAQICPVGSTCNPWETYIYGTGAASQPFAGSLKIPVVPSSSASSAQTIAANLFMDLTSSQTASSKTFTSPTVNGATLAGTIAGSFTFSGVPIFSGLSTGTQTRCLGLDSGNNLVTSAGACGSGGGGLSGMTAGQVPIAATASTVTSSKPLTGNGANVASSTGALNTGDCVSINAGNFVDAGGPCTVGGGGGTVASSTIGQMPVYTAATTVTGTPNLTFSSGLLVLNTVTATPTLPTFSSGPQLFTLAAPTGTQTRVSEVTFGTATGSVINMAAAAGTGASPTALASGSAMGSLQFAPYDGTNITHSARVAGIATENQTPSAHGSKLVFGVTPIGSTTIADTLFLDSTGLTLDINAASVFPAFAGGTPLLSLIGPDTVQTRLGLQTFGNASGSVISMGGAAGTGASPTPLASGSRAGSFQFSGYDGVNFSQNARITGLASETQNSGAHGMGVTVSTTPNGSTTIADRASFSNDGALLMPPTVTGGSQGAGTINAAGLFVNGVAVGGSGTAALSYGTIAGGPFAYTIASPTPAVSSNVANYVVCASIPVGVTTNTGAATLAVGSAAGLPLRRNSSGGALAFAGGEFPGNASGGGEIQTCFKTDSTAGTWVMMSPPGGGTSVNPSAHTITQNEWTNGQYFLCTSACSLTLPNLASTTLSSNAGPVVVTVGVIATITSQGTDGVNNGTIGGINTAGTFYIPADMFVPLFTSGAAGAGAYSASVGPVQYFPFSWLPGMDLSTATAGIRVGRFATPRILYSIRCNIDLAAGAAQTMVFKDQTASGLISAGTTINSGSFNMNGTPGTEVSVTLSASPTLVPTDYWLGAVVTGSATAGSGSCQFTYR